jgi:gamma-glutamylcyclotransferase (GGCT)/AIG2-like uncharacterized protein YtfP
MLDKVTSYFSKTPNSKWINDACDAVANTPDAPTLERSTHHHLFVYCNLQRGRANHSYLSGSQYVATGFTESQYHMWRRVVDPPLPIKKAEEPPVVLTDEEKKRHVFLLPGREIKIIDHAPPKFMVSESVLVPIPKHDQRDITEWHDINRFYNRYEHWAKIKGELWKVPSEQFYLLDKFMANNVLFRRKRIAIEVPLRVQRYYSDGTFVTDRIFHTEEAYFYEAIPEIWEPEIDGGFLFHPVRIFSNSSLNRRFYANTALEE